MSRAFIFRIYLSNNYQYNKSNNDAVESGKFANMKINMSTLEKYLLKQNVPHFVEETVT